ncbi:hypothetical protein [Peptoanaerobacter stomatis]|uniref:hypothetical protein n=1 Tax=Peptoanaerobacter stomatis TaxID=796937 RepID=UPI002FE51D1B
MSKISHLKKIAFLILIFTITFSYFKIKFKNKSFEEIYDFIAVKVVVKELKDCYGVISIVQIKLSYQTSLLIFFKLKCIQV